MDRHPTLAGPDQVIAISSSSVAADEDNSEETIVSKCDFVRNCSELHLGSLQKIKTVKLENLSL